MSNRFYSVIRDPLKGCDLIMAWL